MNAFTTRPSATVRATVFAASVLVATLFLGGVAVGFTWDLPSQIEVTPTTPPAQA
jgi:hypothetical protein